MAGSVPLGPVDALTGIGVLVLCLAGVAFCSGSEAAIISVHKLRIAAWADKGSRAARAVQRLLTQTDRFFGTLLLLKTALLIVATAVFTVLATRTLRSPQGEWELALAALAMTFTIVVCAEIAPKTFATQHPERFAMFVARPLLAAMTLARPAVWAVTSLTNALLSAANRLLRLGEPGATLATRDEIRLLVDVGQAEGGLASDETAMIRSIFELGDTTARAIMVPRIDMVTLGAEATFDEALTLALTEGHTRLPVHGASLDDIVGILYVKDLLAYLASDQRPQRIPRAHLRPAYFIPESKPVDALLREMRRDRLHMAIVMDEYGGTAGLLTIEDILEEIVGEIQDEYDDEAKPAIEELPDGSLLLDGRLAIHEVNAILGLALPDSEFDTLGGFVVGLFGRTPLPGEAVAHRGLHLVADQVTSRRLTRVRLYRNGTGPLAWAALPEGEAT